MLTLAMAGLGIVTVKKNGAYRAGIGKSCPEGMSLLLLVQLPAPLVKGWYNLLSLTAPPDEGCLVKTPLDVLDIAA